MAIAFFSTWTTYGTWLPGDQRGWYRRGHGLQLPDGQREFAAQLVMNEDAITLDVEQRELVVQTITTHCVIRHWTLHAMNCRSNHVHVVISAGDRPIEIPREQFKSWCTRKLKASQQSRGVADTIRTTWWTQRGWDVYVDDDEHLQEVIDFVLERQSRKPDAPATASVSRTRQRRRQLQATAAIASDGRANPWGGRRAVACASG